MTLGQHSKQQRCNTVSFETHKLSNCTYAWAAADTLARTEASDDVPQEHLKWGVGRGGRSVWHGVLVDTCARVSCAHVNVKLGVLDAVQRGAAKVVHGFKLGDVDGGYLQCKQQ